MKYIICDGNRKLKYEQLFSSIEDIIEFLHHYYTFEFIKIQQLHSGDSITQLYTCTYQYVGYKHTSDLLLVACKDYVQKETI